MNSSAAQEPVSPSKSSDGWIGLIVIILLAYFGHRACSTGDSASDSSSPEGYIEDVLKKAGEADRNIRLQRLRASDDAASYLNREAEDAIRWINSKRSGSRSAVEKTWTESARMQNPIGFVDWNIESLQDAKQLVANRLTGLDESAKRMTALLQSNLSQVGALKIKARELGEATNLALNARENATGNADVDSNAVQLRDERMDLSAAMIRLRGILGSIQRYEGLLSDNERAVSSTRIRMEDMNARLGEINLAINELQLRREVLVSNSLSGDPATWTGEIPGILSRSKASLAQGPQTTEDLMKVSAKTAEVTTDEAEKFLRELRH